MLSSHIVEVSGKGVWHKITSTVLMPCFTLWLFFFNMRLWEDFSSCGLSLVLSVSVFPQFTCSLTSPWMLLLWWLCVFVCARDSSNFWKDFFSRACSQCLCSLSSPKMAFSNTIRTMVIDLFFHSYLTSALIDILIFLPLLKCLEVSFNFFHNQRDFVSCQQGIRPTTHNIHTWDCWLKIIS